MYQTKRMMVGTTHQDDWFFYHDALSLMISKGTMDWMEKTVIDGVSIKDRWLVPQNGVNGGTVYEGRPVGNSPEFMPLDNSLNADIKRSHDYHCVVTWHCATGDRRKFSMSTPRLIARGIRRLLENKDGGVPNSERIMNDCDKALDAMYTVYLAGGCIIPELADRNRA